MQSYTCSHKSLSLEREMTYRVYGTSGRLCMVFPSQNGRYYDFENFHMVDTVRSRIKEGALRLVCADSIDAESWSDSRGDRRHRIEMQEKWYHYIVDELLPAVRLTPGETAITCGCSMGASHAANFFFRRPDLFDSVLAMSGIYNAQFFFGDYMDDLLYANSPLHNLANMPPDHPWMDLYKTRDIILCCGQGAWEDEPLESTHRLDDLLTYKDIPHWADYWGFDVSHDWPWWQKQFPYFMGFLLRPEA